LQTTRNTYKGERFNSYTHLIGMIGSVIGLIILVFIAFLDEDPWKIASFIIYGTTLLVLYSCSTLYHSFRGKWKSVFQKLDHIAIYLLIAGTYTPFTLVTLQGKIGWVLFGIVWGLALIGIILDLFQKNEKRILQLVIYLAMGWAVIFAIEPLMKELSAAGLSWLIAGGLFYTAGVIFYILSNKHRLAHGIWHLFVLAGSFSHFITVAQYV
jgi:hemolysin III